MCGVACGLWLAEELGFGDIFSCGDLNWML